MFAQARRLSLSNCPLSSFLFSAPIPCLSRTFIYRVCAAIYCPSPGAAEVEAAPNSRYGVPLALSPASPKAGRYPGDMQQAPSVPPQRQKTTEYGQRKRSRLAMDGLAVANGGRRQTNTFFFTSIVFLFSRPAPDRQQQPHALAIFCSSFQASLAAYGLRACPAAAAAVSVGLAAAIEPFPRACSSYYATTPKSRRASIPSCGQLVAGHEQQPVDQGDGISYLTPHYRICPAPVASPSESLARASLLCRPST